MAHLPPGMEFPYGWMTIDILLIAFLVIDFVFLMLIIGATVWKQGRTPEKRRVVPLAPVSRRHVPRRARAGGHALRHGA